MSEEKKETPEEGESLGSLVDQSSGQTEQGDQEKQAAEETSPEIPEPQAEPSPDQPAAVDKAGGQEEEWEDEPEQETTMFRGLVPLIIVVLAITATSLFLAYLLWLWQRPAVTQVAWEESAYLRGLSANEADAIFPRLVLTRQSLEEQLENPVVTRAIGLYSSQRGREIPFDRLVLRRLDHPARGNTWFRKGDDNGELAVGVQTWPAGTPYWGDPNTDEIYLIGGCGNFFEELAPPRGFPKRPTRVAIRPTPKVAEPPAPRPEPLPCPEPTPPPVVTDEPVALAPPSRFIQPASTVRKETFAQPQAGAVLYGQSSGGVAVYRRTTAKAVTTPPTCDPGGTPPSDPPTDWCY